MSVTTIRPGGTIPKDPADKVVLKFKFEDKLAAGVEISGVPTVVSSEAAVTIDNISLVDSNRAVRFRAVGGVAGTTSTITCHVVTNETPAQEFDRSFELNVLDL